MPISGKIKINVNSSASEFEGSDKVQSLDSRLALRKKKVESEQPEIEISEFSFVLLNHNRFLQGRLSLNTPGSVWQSEMIKFTANSSETQKFAEFPSECTETKQCAGIIGKHRSSLQRNNLLYGRAISNLGTGTERTKTGLAMPESVLTDGESLPLINSQSVAKRTINAAEVNNDFSFAQTKDNGIVNSDTTLVRNNSISFSRQPMLAGSLKKILQEQEQENIKQYDKHNIEIDYIDSKSRYIQSELSQNIQSELSQNIQSELSQKTKKNLKKNQTTTIWNHHVGNQVLLNDVNYNIRSLNDNRIPGENLIFEQLNLFQQMVMNMSNPLLQGMVYRFNLKNYKKDYVVVTKEDSGEYIFDSSSEDVFNLLSLNAKYLQLSNWTLKYSDEKSICSKQMV